MNLRLLAPLLLAACATVAPAPPPVQPAAKPPPPESETVAKRLADLEPHAVAVEAARDDAVWAFWLGGAPGAADPWASHEALLDAEALNTIRRARALEVGEPAKLDRLEALIVGELVGREMREVETQVANLEATVRFTFEGREVLYRELGAALAAEKSAQRRQAIWAASLPAVKQLDAALARRIEARTEALARFGHTRESFAGLLGRTDLEAARAWADRFLTSTEVRWKARISAQRISSRADLPAWLKPSGQLDAAFPKARIAERGTQVLAGLGLYGVSDLTLDLTDSPRKQPLPLTVSGVRVSFKPRGGWKDQQALLSELGRALALRHAPEASRLTIETTAALFAALTWNRAWLEEQQLPPAVVAQAAELGADTLLLQLRRAAGGLLRDLDRAYTLADDPARTRLDIEPLFAGVDTLRASSQAFALARALGAKWWASPASAEVLRAFWKTGELPEDVRAAGASGDALLSAIGATSERTAADPPAQ